MNWGWRCGSPTCVSQEMKDIHAFVELHVVQNLDLEQFSNAVRERERERGLGMSQQAFNFSSVQDRVVKATEGVDQQLAASENSGEKLRVSKLPLPSASDAGDFCSPYSFARSL